MVRAMRPNKYGLLPSNKWLKANGRGELVKAMKARPELFAHLRQEPEPVSERTVIARMNRLNPEQRVGRYRNHPHATYYCREDGIIIGETNNLEAWARESGALAAHETIN